MSSPAVRAAEDRIFATLKSMFSSWLGRVNEAVVGSAQRFGLLPDPTVVYAVAHGWNAGVQVELIPELTTVAAIGWSEAFQQPTFSSTSAHVLEALNTSRNLLQGIPDETHKFIVDDIIAGLSNGDSRQEIIASIQRTLSMTGSDRWTNRAQLIATTEVTRAANAGALAAAVQAERSLGTLLKTWRDSSDHRVRETHRQADGAELPLAQPFLVGGFPLMYPSEPLGPPEEVIGCRCDLSFRRADR